MFIQYVLEKEHVGRKLFVSFLSSGFLEESVKWFVLMISVYPHAHFDEHYDGIVYGASVSLGFATLENILYLFSHGVEHAFIRALLPVSCHALIGVIMGFYLGKARFRRKSPCQMACDFAGRAFMSARFLRFYSYRPQSLGILYVAVYAVFMVVRVAKGKKARSVNMIQV